MTPWVGVGVPLARANEASELLERRVSLFLHTLAVLHHPLKYSCRLDLFQNNFGVILETLIPAGWKDTA